VKVHHKENLILSDGIRGVGTTRFTHRVKQHQKTILKEPQQQDFWTL